MIDRLRSLLFFVLSLLYLFLLSIFFSFFLSFFFPFPFVLFSSVPSIKVVLVLFRLFVVSTWTLYRLGGLVPMIRILYT